VPADPDSLTVAVCPMSRPPDVIGPPYVIPGAMRVIRPIANLDRDGAWVGIARGTGITGCVWAISRVTASVWVTRVTASVWVTRVTASVWATRVTGSVCWGTSIIISAPACTNRDRNEKEQENRPFRSGFRAILGGDRLRLRVINNIHFHILIYGLRAAFTRLSLSKQSKKSASPRSDYTTPWSLTRCPNSRLR
jgi:hypothetical protein